MLEVVVAAALTCTPLTREEGRELVLLALGPSALSAEFKRIEAGTFVFRVSAAGRRLVGWYAVNELSGVVRDWIADGFPVETTPAMAERQRQLRDRHCRSG